MQRTTTARRTRFGVEICCVYASYTWYRWEYWNKTCIFWQLFWFLLLLLWAEHSSLMGTVWERMTYKQIIMTTSSDDIYVVRYRLYYHPWKWSINLTLRTPYLICIYVTNVCLGVWWRMMCNRQWGWSGIAWHVQWTILCGVSTLERVYTHTPSQPQIIFESRE